MESSALKDRDDARGLTQTVVAPTPSRYAPPAPSRYTPLAPSRYRAAAPSRYTAVSRYATVRRYSGGDQERSRYSPNRHGARRPGCTFVRRIVVVIPPLRTQGEMLWLRSLEFEECFRGSTDKESLWELGAVADFTDAAAWNSSHCAEGEDPRLFALIVSCEADTFAECGCEGCNEIFQTKVPSWAVALRAELATDPDRVVQALGEDDLKYLKLMLGLGRTPISMEVARALAFSDTTSGLSAAALDYAVWQIPELFGHDGVKLRAALDELKEEEGVIPYPMENFLVYSGSLTPGTRPSVPDWATDHIERYPLAGEFVVCKINYRSDLSGETIGGGWRSVYLEPEVPQ